jgi:hypothetical protein
MDDRVSRLYQVVLALPRCSVDTPKAALPGDGIYFFFERGEWTEIAGTVMDRVVRVGTHREDGRFPARIRQHYGNRGSGSRTQSAPGPKTCDGAGFGITR